MSLPSGFLDELRDRVTVSSVLGRKLKLEKRGREFIALCPFHSDSKPSLNIVDDKGFYHCFACGAHGDIIKFVMETEGLRFMEAVEQLASLCGMEVPKATLEERERADKRRSLEDVMDLACRWYERQLRTSTGLPAYDYLKDRGLTDETIEKFRLGWAPDSRTALQTAMKSEGVELDMLLEAGLVRRYDDGTTVDYMRNRVLFPITDRRGNVIAFGGRILGDGQPKYLNSPDTPLFHKGRVLYGMAQAREPAHKSDTLVVAEGYMDVIALAQAGFPSVAPLGTALTEDQISALWRLVPEPSICFDGDTAGQAATRRAADRALPLLQPGKSLRFVAMPEKEDPDSLIKANGPGAFRKLLEQAAPMVSFLWNYELARAKTDTPEKRAEFFKHIRQLAFTVADKGVQEAYVDDINRRIQEYRRPKNQQQSYSCGGRGQWRGGRFEPPRRQIARIGTLQAARSNVDAAHAKRRQQLVLATLINHPGLLDEIFEPLVALELSTPSLDRLRQDLLELAESDPDLDRDGFQSALKSRGHEDELEELQSEAVLTQGSFARHTSPHDEAKEKLLELLSGFERLSLERQLEEIQRLPSEQMDEAANERLKALQSALAAHTSADT